VSVNFTLGDALSPQQPQDIPRVGKLQKFGLELLPPPGARMET